MAVEPRNMVEAGSVDGASSVTGALAPVALGPLVEISSGRLRMEVAPQAGGRIAQIFRDGTEQLVGYGGAHTTMIGWGCYATLPWAGRIRDGRFQFDAQDFQLPLNMGAHAIHGVGFAMPWQVDSQQDSVLELSLALPQDERWPFGGTAYQRMELTEDQLDLRLSLHAGGMAMPAVIGWHPWFLKPEKAHFSPESIYPRDAAGIATLPVVPPTPGPWDDCFINTEAVTLERPGQRLHLSSDCGHWVIYDQSTYATCVEPQSGPPDAFNIEPRVLPPGGVLSRWFRMEWQDG
jgi:aldose 1-epimerase